MKKLFFLVLLVVCPLLIAVAESSPLIGHWRNMNGPSTTDLTFRDDGTFSALVSARPGVILDASGTWTSDAKSIDYLYNDVRTGPPNNDPHDHDKLVEISKDYFVIEARDGGQRKYTRVP